MARPLIEPHWLLRTIVAFFTPQTGDLVDRTFIIDKLWKIYPSLRQALPRVPLEIARTIYIRARDTFCLRMAAAQALILMFFFLTVMSPLVFLLVAITFVGMLVRETYVIPTERLGAEARTAIIAAVLMVFLYGLLGGIFPQFVLPAAVVGSRIGGAAATIAFYRYHMAPEVGAAHPFKELLRFYQRRWWVSLLWVAAFLSYLLTLELAAPPKWYFQPYFTTTPAIMLFSIALRVQLNPIGGSYRHRLICITLFTDPYEDEVRMMRDYLLCGADWTKQFDLQSLCEVLSFAFGLAPLALALWQWQSGDPNAARINWFQMAISGLTWIFLIVSWPYLKKFNRRTRAVFDQTIQTFSRGPKIIAIFQPPQLSY